MKIHEYQAKEIFARYQLPVTKEILCFTPGEVCAAAEKLGYPAVVKAQVLTGGRGKAGGVKLVRSIDEARSAGEKNPWDGYQGIQSRQSNCCRRRPF